MILKTHAKLMTGAATALILSSLAVQAEELRFWTTEEQPERLARQEQMAADFAAASGHTVEVIPVTESDLGTRATAAYAAGDLPDVIYHTLQYALPWADAGILDSDAATDVIENLGADTFAPGALALAAYEGGYASVPVDGWTQMIVYRKDLFDAAGLAAPATYADVLAAVEALHNPPEMYGFVAATKVDENFMSQVLEHVFLANGVSPVGPDGVQPLDEAKTIEVLEFYKAIAKASPPGELYWDQSRSLYFSGNAAMIIWSPFILDELAGLRDSAPPTISAAAHGFSPSIVQPLGMTQRPVSRDVISRIRRVPDLSHRIGRAAICSPISGIFQNFFAMFFVDCTIKYSATREKRKES